LLAASPERFDVIVTLNLYGDIISDVAAQISGSVGLCGSANVGDHYAMFEAIHGSAPDIAGKNIANPSGLINAAILMLIHIGQADIATHIENAWLKTIEDGMHTGDIYCEKYSKKKLGTDEFANAVISRLGQVPSQFKVADYKVETRAKMQCYIAPPELNKKLVGIDIFIDNHNLIAAEAIAEKLQAIASPLKLITITSRGLKIWPKAQIEEPFLQHCCCRFQTADEIHSLTAISHQELLKLLTAFIDLKFDVIKTENLYTFNGELGFTLAQGQ
jgi:isocitrate dehydrogenase